MFSGWALKRVYKFVLKRLLGRLLKNELDLKQLEVQLGAGTLELRDLTLDTDYLNDQIGDASLVAFVSGYVGSVRVRIPWKALSTKSCEVELEDVDLSLAPRARAATRAETGGRHAEGEQSEGAVLAESERVLSLREIVAGDPGGRGEAGGGFSSGGRPMSCGLETSAAAGGGGGGGGGGGWRGGVGYLGVDDGVRVIARLVEKILLGLCVRITNVTVRLRASRMGGTAPSGGGPTAGGGGPSCRETSESNVIVPPVLVIHIDWLEYMDESGRMERQQTAEGGGYSTGGTGGVGGGEGGGMQGGKGGEGGEGITLVKRVLFKGGRVELAEDMEEQEKERGTDEDGGWEVGSPQTIGSSVWMERGKSESRKRGSEGVGVVWGHNRVLVQGENGGVEGTVGMVLRWRQGLTGMLTVDADVDLRNVTMLMCPRRLVRIHCFTTVLSESAGTDGRGGVSDLEAEEGGHSCCCDHRRESYGPSSSFLSGSAFSLSDDWLSESEIPAQEDEEIAQWPRENEMRATKTASAGNGEQDSPRGEAAQSKGSKESRHESQNGTQSARAAPLQIGKEVEPAGDEGPSSFRENGLPLTSYIPDWMLCPGQDDELQEMDANIEVNLASSASSSRQLEECVDNVVAMLGDISTFAAPTTISSQLHTLKTEFQQLQSTNADGNPKLHKMPTFQLDRFDDYTQQDPVLWWEAFTTQLRILPVAKHAYIGPLFMNSKGGCQTWLTHLATSHGVDVPDLKDKITWEELTRLWKKRFIVDDAPTLAINRLFTMSQGNTATRDWLTEWQKIAAVPNLDLPFMHLRREFYNMSCAALSQALGDREQYSTFAEIIDKAREIIKTNRSAAHEKSTWQPTYVEKVRIGPRQQHFAAVQSDSGDSPAATPASSDGDQVAAVQPRSNNKSRNNGKAKSASSAEGEATPPSTPPDSAALLAASCTSGEDANVAGSRYTYEDYAVHLVPPLDQPLHVQQSTACTVSKPSATDSAASPPITVGNSSSWSRLEVLYPLTSMDFQWMPVPPTGRLPKPHCNELMAQLRDYLHTAVPTPLMDAGVEVVDLHVYIVKIEREFKTQWYDDIDAPLLYVRIQIGEAICNALIDCGGSRDYISRTSWHKSIDRCIDSIPVHFAPHASEAVSFDILDTKFDMILGMSWLGSKDHPVNFFNRTVHVDRNRVLVPCMVPLPHPSISCHVVSAASIRASMIRDHIEEMGVYSKIAAPMTRLQSPKVPFVFDDDARRSFQALKTAMLMAPVLSIYDPTLPTRVTTDASGYGIGAVLEQHDGGDWHPVEYFSQEVSPINSLDDARKKELLAFVMTLKRWRHFLLGRRVQHNNETKFGSADGQTERAHQTAQMMLRTLIRPDQKDWVDRLPDIEFAYNTSVHPAIGVTPFELHHGGRKNRIFADLLLPRPSDVDAACSPASVRKYRELLTQARANMQKAQVRMQQQANRRRVPCPIRDGDLVWVSAEEFALEHDVSRKLLPKWFGPWSVTAAAGDEPDDPSFVINIPEHLTVHLVFHASKLATYTPAKSDDFPGQRS
ncbi:hypothetical protein CBR_g37914 [Chara braunii]|uniref:Autophagy-related protein 2 n=1 Tax=Chara braunii TaxID=69332 RepID=A0A388LNY2_CHABU|nr:hypothetical protein CBR_g37914 [Chara braunii]|eukprot:GBG84037.1 hypothetical protein CBR_g37914 [Chara braunii]